MHPIHEKIENFAKNYNSINGTTKASHNNIYYIKCENEKGEITNEYYSLNVMTNAGMTKYRTIGMLYWNYLHNSSSSGGLFLGSGSTEPSITDTTLTTPCAYTTPCKDKNSSHSAYNYNSYIISGLTYNPITDLITQRVLIYQCVFDYNLTGITENMTVREIGIGPSITNLYYHALVYDENGIATSFEKKLNEKVSIDVFSTISIKSSIISDLYDQGIYACFNPACYHKGAYSMYTPGYYYNCNGFPRYGSVSSPYLNPMIRDTGKQVSNMVFVNTTYTDFDSTNNIYTNHASTSGSYVIDQVDQTIEKVSISPNNKIWYNSMDAIWMYPTLDNPEEIISTIVCTNGVNNTSLDTNFVGVYDISKYSSSSNSDNNYYYYGHLPINDINITSLKMYNYLTGEFDIPLNMVGNDYHPEARYGLNKMTAKDVNYAWSEYNQIDVTHLGGFGYIVTNHNTSIPLKRLHLDGDTSITIHATDTFWDKTTYEEITDKNNIDRKSVV